ncbi:class II aldolase/adducin family protein [Alkalihalobacillus sp. LMS39]|uniref:class II aldolase/adducin family protein n=1 Tax=Alkalihalobacillus sp. LMS39 TaxID=2924032 RepID=UPI001FB2D817|nr:class II aldolase/adducin family protein [Alkalihalobacillus sp. LMS39]UOE94962.1 class II aldolase/adducin family protein [Alkalihalobacillus sp. LMS39]
MDIHVLHPADQIIMIMERVYESGLTTTSGGNISIYDENGNIWITPASVDKGSLTRRDIVKVNADGTVEGIHKPSSEFPFHQLIYKARSDIKAVIHAHPPALVAFSIVRKVPNTWMVPSVQHVCGEVGLATYALPGSTELGENIADVFKEGINTVILENHGVVVGFPDLFKAYKAFETLDFSARIELEASRIGKPTEIKKELLEKHKVDTKELEDFIPESYGIRERDLRTEMCQLIHRAYKQQLFTSTQGTFSHRLSDNSFLITPYDIDRKYIEPGDIVRIENGKKEIGRTPSRAAMFHQSIYELHPHIESIIIAHPPHFMAFAVTDIHFDSRTIPESYLLLKNVPKLEYEAPYVEPKKAAEVFNKQTPLAIVKNDCVIVTGKNLLHAFDRLEVAEYSAKALISSVGIGDIVHISDKEISDLEEAFNL